MSTKTLSNMFDQNKRQNRLQNQQKPVLRSTPFSAVTIAEVLRKRCFGTVYGPEIPCWTVYGPEVLPIYGDSVLSLEIHQYAMLPTPGVTETCSKVITRVTIQTRYFLSLGNNLDGTIDGFSL